MIPRLTILGSSNAVPDAHHENTHMLFQAGSRSILVDCSGSPVARFEQANLDPLAVTDMIITHFHPDHAGGVPVFLMDLWLMGRKAPLAVRGVQYTLDRLKAVMELYDWGSWPNFYPVEFIPCDFTPLALVIDDPAVKVFASPAEHFLPNIGLRFEFPETGKVVAYSCDTEPCQVIQNMMQGADTIIHEATGKVTGHSSARQAGAAAGTAGARELVLIHYRTGRFSEGDLCAEAGQVYNGHITLAEDFMVLEFDKEAVRFSSAKEKVEK